MEPHRYYDLTPWRPLLYDRLSAHRRARSRIVKALRLSPGASVLVPGCGTGLDFPYLLEAIGPQGRIIGVDYSKGMLRRAQARIERGNWTNVTIVHGDARRLSREFLGEEAGLAEVDGLLFSLVLSVIPDWESIFEQAFSLLRGGGRCVIWDGKTTDGRLRIFNSLWVLLNKLTAAADNRRPTWTLLEGRVSDMELRNLLYGFVFVASGTKP